MVSVIIPTYNEENTIGKLVSYLLQNASPDLLQEVIVVDGGSSDRTTHIAAQAGARVIRSEKKAGPYK
jgi:glycosyltransferase involved in cell wall biosynthesis